jgi:hypothetical protein
MERGHISTGHTHFSILIEPNLADAFVTPSDLTSVATCQAANRTPVFRDDELRSTGHRVAGEGFSKA